MHGAYIGRRSEKTLNASCMTISGGRTEQLYNCRFSAALLALRVIFSVSSCGTYSVLSRSPSVAICRALSSSLLSVSIALQPVVSSMSSVFHYTVMFVSCYILTAVAV